MLPKSYSENWRKSKNLHIVYRQLNFPMNLDIKNTVQSVIIA